MLKQVEIDEKIIERLLDGDENALSELYDKYSGTVKIFAKNMLSLYQLNGLEEDVVQETFIELHKKTTFDKTLNKSFKFWLLGIAKNKVGKEIRKRKLNIKFEEIDRDGIRRLDEMLNYLPTIDENLDEKHSKAILKMAREKLPSPFKETVELIVDAELSIKEVAELLDIAEGTVKSRLNRATKFLSTIVGQLQKQG